MTPSNVTGGKALIKISEKDAPCNEQGRWHLELMRLEPVVNSPFSLCYSLIKPLRLQNKIFQVSHPSVCGVQGIMTTQSRI